ncbi:histidine phosphatase family protein [uncultured Piscinibacter sp.]|mgnify:CR=1 FL=1|uniref:histidine phosphatase family protein n=1 Tax=uncultured Piscinibacter sp. TaxID=1131835 RepID=UPI00263354F5|nr:histidine phosphatase family protein [uncultured Piscinibacter sp.]
MRLLLVRHGETALNAARVLQPPDTPLSERGRAQAAALAQRLSDEPVSLLWSSDLSRAWQTAESVALACRLPLVPQPLLRERNFGVLRGQPYDALGFDPLALASAPPQGESVAAFEARVDEALAQALAAARGSSGTVVVVTHGLVIHSLLARRLALPAGNTLPSRIANTSVTVIEDGVPPRATRVDCTAHLGGGPSDNPLALSGG